MSILSTKLIFQGRVVRLNVETVRLPNGHVADLEIIHHPGGAAVAAIDERRRVCLIRQYRHAVGGWIWELPAGKLEPNEPALTTAQRELAEETGTAAKVWRSLGGCLSSPGVLTETVHLFLATQSSSAPLAHEPGELIEIHWLDLQQACTLAETGGIDDAKTAVGLLRARAALAIQASSDLGNGTRAAP